jgi:hypothetical protein
MISRLNLFMTLDAGYFINMALHAFLLIQLAGISMPLNPTGVVA